MSEKIQTIIEASQIHAEWRPLLLRALSTLDDDYQRQLIESQDWLPGLSNLLGAFRRDLSGVKYVLIGESPYPRETSANGIAFYDAAVGDLWSDSGLSKSVNRATSMRNILKTALRAEGRVEIDENGKISQAAIAGIEKTALVKTMSELFDNLHGCGFLMLNATPVLHATRKPALEAAYWRGFLQTLLASMAENASYRISLILWGKIAAAIESLPASASYDKLISEHPYNISFIDNPIMLKLFADIRVLSK